MDPLNHLNLPASPGEPALDDHDTHPEGNDYLEEAIDVGLVGGGQLNIPQEPFVPFPPLGPPDCSEMPGQFNFKVDVTTSEHPAHTYMFWYSSLLDRIYVDIDSDFSMLFDWDLTPSSQDMYVRATTVFVDEEQAQQRVERCVPHYNENSNMKKEIASNVLHSSRTQGVYYCGNTDMLNSWYSVLVHCRRLNNEPYCHAYKFTCKNTCTPGINRRAIAVIFTLEDSVGHVYGRQHIGAKVSACPRRDLFRDEEIQRVDVFM